MVQLSRRAGCSSHSPDLQDRPKASIRYGSTCISMVGLVIQRETKAKPSMLEAWRPYATLTVQQPKDTVEAVGKPVDFITLFNESFASLVQSKPLAKVDTWIWICLLEGTMVGRISRDTKRKPPFGGGQAWNLPFGGPGYPGLDHFPFKGIGFRSGSM